MLRRAFTILAVLLVLFSIPAGRGAYAQTLESKPSRGRTIYEQLKSFSLDGGTAPAEYLTLRRGCAEILFKGGTFYFSNSVAGDVREAVFVGEGSFRADPPHSGAERALLERLVKSDAVESDFETAVLRFTDDTFRIIGKDLRREGRASRDARRLASEFEGRFVKETGANVSARQMLSILNKESPGMFLAEFDKGKRGRFSLLIDPQGRIPEANFGIDGDEKGLIFAYNKELFADDVWMTFGLDGDGPRSSPADGGAGDLVSAPHIRLQVDVRDPAHTLRVTAQIDLVTSQEGILAIPFMLNEDLTILDDQRLKYGMRVTAARELGGRPLEVVEEPWEEGFTLLLTSETSAGERLSVEMDLEGNAMETLNAQIPGWYRLRGSASWYPRHSLLTRSTLELTLLYSKDVRIASTGDIVSTNAGGDGQEFGMTRYTVNDPIALATFSMGPYRIRSERVEIKGKAEIPIELYDLPFPNGDSTPDLTFTELSNMVRYFSELFGPYPYAVLRTGRFGIPVRGPFFLNLGGDDVAVPLRGPADPSYSNSEFLGFYRFPFVPGSTFETMIPLGCGTIVGEFGSFADSFQVASQWWEGQVTWRSYRDQWLGAGLAIYSAGLYVGARVGNERKQDLMKRFHDELEGMPRSRLGAETGRIEDVGPVTLGHRLNSNGMVDAYADILNYKSALIMRMLHFLFTDPKSGDGQPFFDMLQDFLRRNRNRTASLQDFLAVANEHFVQTPIAKQFGLTNLDWFVRQWVDGTYLPAYRFAYTVEELPGGKFAIQGTLSQRGLPEGENWFMPLPLFIRYAGGKTSVAIVSATGKYQPINLIVDSAPTKVELDPEQWVLSDKTSTEKLTQ